jgi:ATP phosphoribosyltransferase
MNENNSLVELALPKGSMYESVRELLFEAGIKISSSARGYRPTVTLSGFDAKILRPPNIVKMLCCGSRDVGFAGADWVAELEAELVELLDTKLDPVRIVAAAPASILEDGQLPKRRLVIASELERLTREWIAARQLDALFVQSWGATEVFPPEDADLIVDVVATGATLKANNLVVIDELMRSSTRLFASPQALDDPVKHKRIEGLLLLLESVLQARQRVMLEVNVPQERLEAVVAALPCMREPTIAPLHGGAGYAVKAAAPRNMLTELIPEIKRLGGTDITVTKLMQIVP